MSIQRLSNPAQVRRPNSTTAARAIGSELERAIDFANPLPSQESALVLELDSHRANELSLTTPIGIITRLPFFRSRRYRNALHFGAVRIPLCCRELPGFNSIERDFSSPALVAVVLGSHVDAGPEREILNHNAVSQHTVIFDPGDEARLDTWAKGHAHSLRRTTGSSVRSSGRLPGSESGDRRGDSAHSGRESSHLFTHRAWGRHSPQPHQHSNDRRHREDGNRDRGNRPRTQQLSHAQRLSRIVLIDDRRVRP